jgi:GDSL-like lipase/acylhydrolase family protein
VTRGRIAKLLVITLPATALALAAFAIAVEAWTRLHWDPLKGTPGFFLSDAARRQRLAPGYADWFAGVPVRINSLGLRDAREYALAKSPRTFRILVLGDSVTFGHGSVDEHTYPYLVEQRLRAWRGDIDWQVWNAAVPGYNTSQELAQLLEVGPVFQPDLVIVGFFENDVVDNYEVNPPAAAARLWSATLSWLYQHVYSISLYKRAYLELAWRLSASNSYRLRLAHVADEGRVLEHVQDARDLEGQRLTRFDRLDDAQVRGVACRAGASLPADIIEAMQRESGWGQWTAAVRRLQQLRRDGAYRLMFFVNIAPLVCPTDDVFFDGGSSRLNAFFMRALGEDGTPVVSSYDAFLHVRPSQMPDAGGHSFGNSNAVKADALFAFLRDALLPRIADGRAAAILRAASGPVSSGDR